MLYSIDSWILYSLAGVAYGKGENPKLSFWKAVNLRVGVNKIALLSATVGLQVGICIHDQSTPFAILGGRGIARLLLMVMHPFIDFRILVCILNHGMPEFLALSPCLVSMMENGTCHVGNGPTRFVSSIVCVTDLKPFPIILKISGNSKHTSNMNHHA